MSLDTLRACKLLLAEPGWAANHLLLNVYYAGEPGDYQIRLEVTPGYVRPDGVSGGVMTPFVTHPVESSIRRLDEKRLRRHRDRIRLSVLTQTGDNWQLVKELARQGGWDFITPCRVPPECLTTDVRGLVRAIERDRDHHRFPILADALRDADCDREDVLEPLADTAHPQAMRAFFALVGQLYEEAVWTPGN